MQASEIEALGTICVLAALADGTMGDGEREHVKAAFEGLGDGAEARALAPAYRRAILAETTVEDEARAPTTPEARRYAFEMAVAVCDADGHHSEREKRFLDKHAPHSDSTSRRRPRPSRRRTSSRASTARNR